MLTAVDLGAWLDDLQNTYTTKVTVLIDCCYAGSFLDELAYTGVASRIVIAACGTNEPTYFMAGGVVSFSDAFFGGVMRGDDVEQAWVAASNAMCGYQNACWNDPGREAANLYLGASFVAGKDIPQIGSVMGNQLLSKTTAATLWAGDVVSVYSIQRVWCLVVPPGHRPDPENPVTDLSELDLTYDSSSGRYQARYEGFSEEGSYKVLFYAEDGWGSVSPPRQSYVTQSSYNERMILVAGGPTNQANWTLINGLARYAYRTFQARGLNHEKICYLNAAPDGDVDGDGMDDVDALISLANLANAITNWARSADALTVYLLGDGTNQILRLNETEVLDANSLNHWLNAFSISNEQAKVNVIMDFSGSGGFLSDLAASNRICIASCRSNQPAIWAAEGLVSFSRYFLSGLFEGDTLYQAYSSAGRAIRRATGSIRQRAQLDDNEDGLFNKTDGSLARRRYIGVAFMTGADTPTIGDVTPDTVLTDTNALWLWASGVTDMDGISNVWCVVTPPSYDGGTNLESIDLVWTNARYEARYTNFSTGGVYVLTFQAVDSNGVVSLPLQAEVRTEVIASDVYEPDNTYREARLMAWNETQTNHNFHSSNDEDWVCFYAASNFIYEIETIQRGENVDTVLEVFYELADGTLTNYTPEEERDITAVGQGEGEITWLYHPTPGRYYVRVSSGDPNAWGVSSEYELTIKVPMGGGVCVQVFDTLRPSQPPSGTTIATVDGIWTLYFNGENSKSCNDIRIDPSLTHTVEIVLAAGYRMAEDPSNQITDTHSAYSNPQLFTSLATFLVYPYVQVYTGSVIRDRWTHERLSDVKIIFHPTSPGPTIDYDGYPPGATWKSNWYSQSDGTFPTNVWLRKLNYDLILTKESYSNSVFPNVIVNPKAGDTIILSNLWLSPLDANTGVATIWSNTTAPTVVDGGPDKAVELGVKFKSDVAGTITGIRFYKAAANTGAHVGNLWTSNGTWLATATFTNETASGWQQTLFAAPVAIASNMVYVASYHANNGHYSADGGYFMGNGVDHLPLHAPADEVSGGNGVYAYGSSSVFPNQTYNAANYWVDVVFLPGSPPPPPTLTSLTLMADISTREAAAKVGENVERWPWVWTSGDFSKECGASHLIDGNTNTIWIGNVSGEPWRVILDLGVVTDMTTGIQLMFQDTAWTNKEIIGSRDSEVWFDYLAETNEGVPLRYLYINFWGDEHGAQPPAIREIIWRDR